MPEVLSVSYERALDIHFGAMNAPERRGFAMDAGLIVEKEREKRRLSVFKISALLVRTCLCLPLVVVCGLQVSIILVIVYDDLRNFGLTATSVPDVISAENRNETGTYPNSDGTDKFVRNLRIVGVKHTPEAFDAEGPHVISAIRASDVICLEHGAYFDSLASYAESVGKRVVWVDNQGPISVAMGIPIPAIVLWQCLGIAARGRRRSGHWIWAFPVGYAAICMGAPGPSMLADLFDAPYLKQFSLSYAEVGRTALMLDRARSRASNPSERVLWVTGNAHAAAAIGHPDDYAPDSWRTSVYKATYGRVENATRHFANGALAHP